MNQLCEQLQTKAPPLSLYQVMAIYAGSDGAATSWLFAHLAPLGPAGEIAINLFRVCKSSERAKVYRGGERGRGSYRSMSYERKEWALGNLAKALTSHAEELRIVWGWKEDPKQDLHRWVLYVDLPNGQVSFHTARRGDGPDYPGEWDGARRQTSTRICRYTSDLLMGQESVSR